MSHKVKKFKEKWDMRNLKQSFNHLSSSYAQLSQNLLNKQGCNSSSLTENKIFLEINMSNYYFKLIKRDKIIREKLSNIKNKSLGWEKILIFLKKTLSYWKSRMKSSNQRFIINLITSKCRVFSQAWKKITRDWLKSSKDCKMKAISYSNI